MRFIQASLTLAALTKAAVLVDNSRKPTGLEVTLAPATNAAEVIAMVKNVGTESLNLLTLGTFLDSAPIQKLDVLDAAANSVAFTGVFRRIQFSDLAASNFQALEAGATYTTTINAAAVHDLSASGTYSFVTEGAIPFAIGNSTELTGAAVSYKSNTLTMAVDGAAAAILPKAIRLSERTRLQSDGTTAQRSATTKALSNCAALARAAATAASSGSSTKFSEYFKTTSTSARSVVAARLNAVATSCASTTSGSTYYYNTDVYGYCESNVLAYTIPSTNEIINCPLYYSALPALTGTCHAQDQATTTLHEMTHAPGVYSPGTADNGYGYAAATALTSARAVLNADSYALYANAIYVGC